MEKSWQYPPQEMYSTLWCPPVWTSSWEGGEWAHPSALIHSVVRPVPPSHGSKRRDGDWLGHSFDHLAFLTPSITANCTTSKGDYDRTLKQCSLPPPFISTDFSRVLGVLGFGNFSSSLEICEGLINMWHQQRPFKNMIPFHNGLRYRDHIDLRMFRLPSGLCVLVFCAALA